MKRRKLQNQLDTAQNTRIIVTDSDSSSTGATRKRKSKDSNWIVNHFFFLINLLWNRGIRDINEQRSWNGFRGDGIFKMRYSA